MDTVGGINQAYFVKEFLPQFHGRILEVGSKDYGSTIQFREMFQYESYVGLDMAEGKGVDLVANIEERIEVDPVDLIICCSVLEHVRNPWKAAENLSHILKPGGRFYFASPWVQRYHGYPDDYWRFSFSAVPVLFPKLEWGEMYYSTLAEAEFFKAEPESENMRGMVAKDKEGVVREKFLPYTELHAIGVRPQILGTP